MARGACVVNVLSETKNPTNRVIHVGEGVNDGTHIIEEKVEVPFETEIQFDDSLAPGEMEEVQKGEAGEKKRDINLTIQDGKVTKTEEGEFTANVSHELKSPLTSISGYAELINIAIGNQLLHIPNNELYNRRLPWRYKSRKQHNQFFRLCYNVSPAYRRPYC